MAANPREESRVVRTISSLVHAAKATKLDGPSVCPYDLSDQLRRTTPCSMPISYRSKHLDHLLLRLYFLFRGDRLQSR